MLSSHRAFLMTYDMYTGNKREERHRIREKGKTYEPAAGPMCAAARAHMPTRRARGAPARAQPSRDPRRAHGDTAPKPRSVRPTQSDRNRWSGAPWPGLEPRAGAAPCRLARIRDPGPGRPSAREAGAAGACLGRR